MYPAGTAFSERDIRPALLLRAGRFYFIIMPMTSGGASNGGKERE